MDADHPGNGVLIPRLITLHPDTELVHLGRELDEAWQAERLAVEEAVEGAILRCRDIVEQIEGRTATTLDGLKVKALAVSWCHDGEPSAWAGHRAQATDRRLVGGILNDILAAGSTM